MPKSKNSDIKIYIEMFQDLDVYSDQVEAIKKGLRQVCEDEDLDIILPLLSAYKRRTDQATRIIKELRRLMA